MERCGQKMEVTLQVYGREMTFTEQELIAIVEKHFSNQATKQELKKTEVVRTPTEGKWFEVNPLRIDENLFSEKRKEFRQEVTRRLILEAFTELKHNPEKYGRTYETMMPEKKWTVKSVSELIELARFLGDNNADWVEQAFEWAQRISNGESWGKVCNEADTANWLRLVVWKGGHVRLIGGSNKNDYHIPATNVGANCYGPNCKFEIAVPLIVRYK